MISNILPEPKELMSESLQDIVTDEQMVKTYHDTFISLLLVYEDKEKCLIGNLVGLEMYEDVTHGYRIDLRTSMKDAYFFISNLLTDQSMKNLDMIILSLGDNHTKVKGPFLIKNSKIIDIDSSNKLCVLAIDLEKIGEKNEER